MKLVELVNYFRHGGSYEEFCQSESIDLESEVIEIYMRKPFNLDNNLAFFEIEKTEGNIEFIFDSEKYFNLFDFYYFLDVIKESNNSKNKSLTDREIASRLLSYSINDA